MYTFVAMAGELRFYECDRLGRDGDVFVPPSMTMPAIRCECPGGGPGKTQMRSTERYRDKAK
jgi:hypothetical protein